MGVEARGTLTRRAQIKKNKGLNKKLFFSLFLFLALSLCERVGERRESESDKELEWK